MRFKVVTFFVLIILTFSMSALGQVCGDVTGNSTVDMTDYIALNSYIFDGGSIGLSTSANVDGQCTVNIADLIYLYENLFLGGPALFCETAVLCDYPLLAGCSLRIGDPPYYIYPGNDSVAIPVYLVDGESKPHGQSSHHSFAGFKRWRYINTAIISWK